MENIILCPECQGTGRLPRTKKKETKKKIIKEFSISPAINVTLDEQRKEDEEIECVICFRCGGLGTISI